MSEPATAPRSATPVQGVRVGELMPSFALPDRVAVRYISIPVAGAEGIDAAKASQLHAVLAAADGPVLVHCASGNRVGGLLALMQARSGAMTPEQALDFGRKAGMVSTEARVRQLLDQQRCLLAAQDGSAPAQHCP